MNSIMRKSHPIRLKASLAERQVDRLRLVVLGVALLIAPWAWVGEATNPRLALLLLAIGWVYGLVLVFGVPPRPGLLRSHITTAVDGLLSLGWIAATGGVYSPAYALLFIIAFATAVRYPPRVTWWTTGLLAVGYLGMLALRGQLVPHLYASFIRVAVFLTGMYLGLEISRVTLRQTLERVALEHQRAVQETRARLIALLQSSQDAIIGLDPTGLITHWNPGAEHITGYAEPEAVGRPITFLLEAHPARRLGNFLARAVKGGASEPLEEDFRTREGLVRTLSLTAAPVRDEEGRLVALSVIARDVTVRNQAERELRESQRLLEESQRQAHLGSFEWSAAQDRSLWSAELYRLVGVDPRTSAPGLEAFLEHLHPEDRGRLRAEVLRLLREGGTFDLECRVLRAGGAPRWLRLRGEAEGPPAAPLVLRGTAQDITELRAALEARMRLAEEHAARMAAEEALHVRDDFITVAAHELKTPLTSLKLHLQAALKAVSGDSQEARASRSRLERAVRQATRLDQLVESLLDVSRVARGRLDLVPRPTDLAEHVRASAERFAESAARAGCELHLSADVPVVGEWDPLRIDQLIDNLLSNAIKYGAGRPVEVTVSQVHGVARLRVRDHGISIRPEDRARIFERFERAVSSRHFGGLGLGLWVVREVASAMGGRATVRSTPGEGSTFIVSLPLHPEYTAAEDGSSRPPVSGLPA
jgi:PAS domain S-box-containing protein